MQVLNKAIKDQARREKQLENAQKSWNYNGQQDAEIKTQKYKN